MKKKLLSLALALVMCLSLTIPAFAAEDDPILNLDVGETTFVINGVTFTLSNPVSGHTTDDDATYPVTGRTINVVPAGTTVTLSPNSEDIDDKVWGEAYGIDEETGEPTWLPIDMTTVNGGSFDDESIISFASYGEDDTYIYITGRTSEEAAEDKKDEAPAETEAPAEAPAAPKFTDVAADSPFAAAIDWAVAQGITLGTTESTFGPSNTCSISNILTFLWRANGKPGAAEGAADRDSAAKWAVEQELVAGDQDTSAPCTRAMAVTFMWKAAGSPEADASKLAFTDFAAEDSFAPAVAWAVENKVTSGTSETTFSPDNTCTRGQIVTFLYRAANAAAEAAAE